MTFSIIKFSYLYRDGANYKKYQEIHYTNKFGLDLEFISNSIRKNLIDELWFNASKWEVPDLHFEKWNQEFDHDYHEFVSVEVGKSMENMVDDISCLLSKIKL